MRRLAIRSLQHRTPTGHPAADQLAQLVADATGASSAQVDEHYTMTAIVIERPAHGHIQTIVVELVDHGTGHGNQRWNATAYDELHNSATGLSNGPTPQHALAAINWASLTV